jgi:hypothetical protein
LLQALPDAMHRLLAPQQPPFSQVAPAQQFWVGAPQVLGDASSVASV